MIFLNKFRFLNEDDADQYLPLCGIFNSCTPDEYYPLRFFNPYFTGQRIEQLDFEDITILYGGNGSGKTTLLNIMAEKLEVVRRRKYIPTVGFTYYIDHCSYKFDEKPLSKKFLASDDIFDHILSVREENKSIKTNKIDEIDYFNSVNKTKPGKPQRGYKQLFSDGVKLNFESDDKSEYEKLSRFVSATNKTKKQFVRSRAGEMQRQYSNGENALMFFDKEIENDALYFLDEPENSMSPRFQIELKALIEDSVRYKNCQFVIATHSPFILSLHDAKIYNLDANPVTVERWYELENVQYYYDFFKVNRDCFE